MKLRLLISIVISALTSLGYCGDLSTKSRVLQEQYTRAAEWFESASKIQNTSEALAVLSPDKEWTCTMYKSSGSYFRTTHYIYDGKKLAVTLWSTPAYRFTSIDKELTNKVMPFFLYTIKNGDLVGFDPHNYWAQTLYIPFEVIRYSKQSGELLIRQGYFNPTGDPAQNLTTAYHYDPYTFLKCK